MQVKEAMHMGAEWMAPTSSLFEVAETMRKHDIGAVPIGEDDRLIGMVTDREEFHTLPRRLSHHY